MPPAWGSVGIHLPIINIYMTLLITILLGPIGPKLPGSDDGLLVPTDVYTHAVSDDVDVVSYGP